MLDLDALLAANDGRLRPPDYVMAPERLGAARLTRYSFSRTLLRRAEVERWQAERCHLDLDDDGQGEVAYQIDAQDHQFHFVAFLQALPESAHTDRVIADRWEIAAALVEGPLDEARWAQLRENVPNQEDGRHDPGVLALTRGNRSVRFFERLVDVLASGEQPSIDEVGDAGYIMRSTAFYANGKYGMRSFDGYRDGHPLAAPYRAQFLAAWCYRELSYDVVEHCARARGGEAAARLTGEWRTFFGLGNATGLGLVPYAFKHPRIINAWIAVRELALANVLRADADQEAQSEFDWWMDRAIAHFATGTSADADPFLSPAELVPIATAIRDQWNRLRTQPQPFAALLEWARGLHVEAEELVVALLVELDRSLDETVDRLLLVDEHAPAELAMSVADARRHFDDRFGWVGSLDPSAARSWWWVYSDNTEEPRRAPRAAVALDNQDMGIDVAARMGDLGNALATAEPDATLGALVADNPELIDSVARLFVSDQPYGEPRDDATASGYLPLQLQRFQLAQYGMDNFKPKSTDWLRVTLFQGAPRLDDLGTDRMHDRWALPPMPRSTR